MGWSGGGGVILEPAGTANVGEKKAEAAKRRGKKRITMTGEMLGLAMRGR